ncbi:hypothetical protein C8J56DRAFT_955982 [Mycena floridula]|nr:hypothetical protein C8J56DRAFT_955982 [Mycena floridula]
MHYSRPLLFSLIFRFTSARFLHSLPEDAYAFPKFKVVYLNNLPVSNETAQRWLNEGLHGGELEFLEQPWSRAPFSRKEIDGSVSDSASLVPEPAASYSLEHMHMGPRDSYLCFIPEPLDLPPPPPDEEVDDNVTPAHSWSLLQDLSGTCLYHRQMWFTYSYCHNDEIRQFKALPQTQVNGAGGYKPEEDPEWEAYTLGKAPVSPKPGADLTVAEQNDLAANLELARGAGSRYLVQRWSDGSFCDKAGKRREVEVQFHCSMAMPDHILFVKETKTCSYVVVINTPRLCGEPGFKSRRDIGEQAVIRCREIQNSPEKRENLPSGPDTDYPFKNPLKKTVLPPAEKISVASGEEEGGIASAIKTFMISGGAESNVWKKLLGLSDDGEDVVQADGLTNVAELNTDELVEILRAAGYDVTGKKKPPTEEKAKKKGNQKGESGKGKTAPEPRRDEL